MTDRGQGVAAWHPTERADGSLVWPLATATGRTIP